MTKRTVSFIMALLIIFSILPASFAFAKNKVDRVEMLVELQKDGSAVVSQTWTGEFDSDTQCRFKFYTKNKNAISNLNVFDGEGNIYEFVDNWDESWSFEQKRNKCAVVYTEYGFDICWGISEYGENTYNLKYTIPELVTSYSDSDGFNFRFVPSDTGITSADIVLAITHFGQLLTEQNSTVTATGFDGKPEYKQGAVIIDKQNIGKKEHITVMMNFNKGLFDPISVNSETFETEVEIPARDGKDYGDTDNTNIFAIIIVAAAIFVALILIIIIIAIVAKKRKNKKSK